jgi:putative transposase
LRNRGLQDIFIACVDGLKGFPQAIEAVYPNTIVQLCIVHLTRASLNYVNWKERKAVAADLKAVYRAPTAEQAEQALSAFALRWDKKYPPLSALWRRHWAQVTPFFAFPDQIRKVIYTTNAIESLNMTLRKVIKTRGSFPSEETAMKLLYLAPAKRGPRMECGSGVEASVKPLRHCVGRPLPTQWRLNLWLCRLHNLVDTTQ